jgi:hypothetical protein
MHTHFIRRSAIQVAKSDSEHMNSENLQCVYLPTLSPLTDQRFSQHAMIVFIWKSFIFGFGGYYIGQALREAMQYSIPSVNFSFSSVMHFPS